MSRGGKGHSHQDLLNACSLRHMVLGTRDRETKESLPSKSLHFMGGDILDVDKCVKDMTK